MWSWFVKDIVTIVNSKMFCVVHFVCTRVISAGILNFVKEIHFFVLCSEKLYYADYVEKCIAGKECTFTLPTDYDFKVVTVNRFQLQFGGNNIY